MPDGSDSPDLLERARATLDSISPPAPPAVPQQPLTREQAEAYHRQGRIIAAGTASVADLCGVVALGLLGNVWVGLALGAGYVWLANRNHDIQHPRLGNYWEAKDHTLFADMVRNYGTSLTDQQTPENFKPYNPKRGKWSYRLGGIWCGWTSRTVGSCIARELASRAGKALGWRPQPRRDPLRPERRETEQYKAPHLRKK